MNLLVGPYDCTLDAKNRLMIPADFRRVLDKSGASGRWYAICHIDNQLWLMPEEEFAAQVARFTPTLLPKDEQLEFVPRLFSRSRLVEPDKQGRIVLPEALLAKANLGREVTLVGMGRHVVVYDRQRLAAEDARDDYDELFRKARAAGIESEGGSV